MYEGLKLFIICNIRPHNLCIPNICRWKSMYTSCLNNSQWDRLRKVPFFYLFIDPYSMPICCIVQMDAINKCYRGWWSTSIYFLNLTWKPILSIKIPPQLYQCHIFTIVRLKLWHGKRRFNIHIGHSPLFMPERDVDSHWMGRGDIPWFNFVPRILRNSRPPYDPIHHGVIRFMTETAGLSKNFMIQFPVAPLHELRYRSIPNVLNPGAMRNMQWRLCITFRHQSSENYITSHQHFEACHCIGIVSFANLIGRRALISYIRLDYLISSTWQILGDIPNIAFRHPKRE